jgi:hypothetical protein
MATGQRVYIDEEKRASLQDKAVAWETLGYQLVEVDKTDEAFNGLPLMTDQSRIYVDRNTGEVLEGIPPQKGTLFIVEWDIAGSVRDAWKLFDYIIFVWNSRDVRKRGLYFAWAHGERYHHEGWREFSDRIEDTYFRKRDKFAMSGLRTASEIVVGGNDERNIQSLLSLAIDGEPEDRIGSLESIINTGEWYGLKPASTFEMYRKMISGQSKRVTVPSFNVSTDALEQMRQIFRQIQEKNVGLVVIELPLKGHGYTPKMFKAIAYAAAMLEGYRGQIALKSSYYMTDWKLYLDHSGAARREMKYAIRDAIFFGNYYNIGLDNSGLLTEFKDRKIGVDALTAWRGAIGDDKFAEIRSKVKAILMEHERNGYYNEDIEGIGRKLSAETDEIRRKELEHLQGDVRAFIVRLEDKEIDSLVDELLAKQVVNAQETAISTIFIRGIEPKGITVAVSGELNHTSLRPTDPGEFAAFMELYNGMLQAMTNQIRQGKQSIIYDLVGDNGIWAEAFDENLVLSRIKEMSEVPGLSAMTVQTTSQWKGYVDHVAVRAMAKMAWRYNVVLAQAGAPDVSLEQYMEDGVGELHLDKPTNQLVVDYIRDLPGRSPGGILYEILERAAFVYKFGVPYDEVSPQEYAMRAALLTPEDLIHAITVQTQTLILDYLSNNKAGTFYDLFRLMTEDMLDRISRFYPSETPVPAHVLLDERSPISQIVHIFRDLLANLDKKGTEITIHNRPRNLVVHLGHHGHIPTFVNVPGIMHVAIVELPPNAIAESLHPLGINVEVPGTNYSLPVDIGIENGMPMIYVDMSPAQDAVKTEEDISRILTIAAPQIIRSYGGTDNLGANPRVASRFNRLLREAWIREKFKPAVLVNHLPVELDRLEEEFSIQGINTVAVINASELPVEGLNSDPLIEKMLVKNRALSVSFSRNKIFDIGAKTMREFTKMLSVFNAAGNGQMLVNWDVFETELTSGRITRDMIKVLLKGDDTHDGVRKNGVLVHLTYTVKDRDTVEQIRSLYDLGFASIDLDVSHVSFEKAHEIANGMRGLSLMDVNGAAVEGFPRRVRYVLGQPPPSFAPQDVLEIVIPKELNEANLRKALRSLPLANSMIIDMRKLSDTLDSTRAFDDKQFLISLLKIMLAFGRRDITSPEAARRLGFAWDFDGLPLLARGDVRKVQLKALARGDMKQLDPGSAIYEQAEALKKSELQQSFLEAIAQKMLIKAQLTDKGVKEVFDAYVRGVLPQSREYMLGVALMKRGLLDDQSAHDEIKAKAALEQSLANLSASEVTQHLSNEINGQHPIPGALTLTIELIMIELTNDSHLKNSRIEMKVGTIDLNAVNDLIAAG